MFASPTDMERAARQPRAAGFFEPATPPAEFFDERDRLVTLRDPTGRRWMRVDPASEEYAEMIEDGWR